MIIGLDVGGTHTEAVLLSKNGLERKIKVITDSSDLFHTVLSAFTTLLQDRDPKTIQRVVFSTTLTTNAIVQNKNLEPVGMIVSAGPGIDPEAFRTGAHYYAVAGSINHRGREKEPVNEQQIKEIAGKLQKAGIETVGVVSKFCVRNPAHEILIRRILNKYFNNIFLGHHVSGNLNFPRRIATTHLNAAVFKLHKGFFEAVTRSLEKKGIKVPILILKADGGTMTMDASMQFPAQTILSGPAASIMGAIPHALEHMDTIVMDIGGTTTDFAVLINRVPLLEPVGIRRGRFKSLIRSLRTYSKGIGGDSVVEIKNGELSIGPERKGPALAFGGPVLTPTDALVFSGKMTLGDKEKAANGIHQMAVLLGRSPEDTAAAIIDKTCAIILDSAFGMVERINNKPVYTVHEFLEGYKTVPEKILLLGGPADCFVERIQALSGIKTDVVPAFSVANAIGAATARTTCEVSLFADTEQGVVNAPEEDFAEPISKTYSEDDAVETAYNLLREKALNTGADPDNLDEVEVVEFQKFNIVRNFTPRGKIYRTKIQLKPGLIKGFESVCRQIERE